MRNGLIKLGQIIWRIWFYFLVALPIVVFLPFLVFFTISEKTYGQFFWMAREIWANTILYGIGCRPKIFYDQGFQEGKSYMLVANHTSMLDIMLMLRVSPDPFVFVGKKELVRIPLFGFFYKRVCILVDRADPRSRSGVYRRAQKRLRGGISICIFPEGGVPEEAVLLDSFKDGAFKMAIAHEIPIVPITFYDNKSRFPFRFFAGGPGLLRARVHPFLQTKGLSASDASSLREQTRNILLRSLEKGFHNDLGK